MFADAYLPLFLFAAVSTLSPGGATTLATASGAHFGYRRSLPLMVGIALGLASMAAVAAIGLAAILMAIPGLQVLLKSLGSIYLIWLAWRLARSGAPGANASSGKPTTVIGGLWLLWHNPKGWAMTMSAAASFAALTEGPVSLAALLGITFGIAAFISLTLWCLLGRTLGRILQQEWQWRFLNVVLAILLVMSILPMWH